MASLAGAEVTNPLPSVAVSQVTSQEIMGTLQPVRSETTPTTFIPETVLELLIPPRGFVTQAAN